MPDSTKSYHLVANDAFLSGVLAQIWPFEALVKPGGAKSHHWPDTVSIDTFSAPNGAFLSIESF